MIQEEKELSKRIFYEFLIIKMREQADVVPNKVISYRKARNTISRHNIPKCLYDSILSELFMTGRLKRLNQRGIEIGKEDNKLKKLLSGYE